MVGGTVSYAATLKSWMADSSTAGDWPYGQNTAKIGKFTLTTNVKNRKECSHVDDNQGDDPKSFKNCCFCNDLGGNGNLSGCVLHGCSWLCTY